MNDSPCGAAALLRLAIEKLCEHLGTKGKRLNDYITSWAEEALDSSVEHAMHTVCIVGNNAVHPGKIDLKDAHAIVGTLLHLVNYIAEEKISEPKRIKELFEAVAAPTQEKQRN